MNHVGPNDLVAPEYVNDGDAVFVRKENRQDAVIWAPARVICAMGNHARVAFRIDGVTFDEWRALSALRVMASTAEVSP